jgi:hypothetical protein
LLFENRKAANDMKKIFIGVFAVAAAFAAFAFSSGREDASKTNLTYWFPTDANGQVTDFEIPTSETTQPCNGGDEVYCALGYPENSPYISVQGGMVTLNDSNPLAHGIPSKRDQ